MITTKELNQDIMEITLKIRDRYPELIKYLDEMPVRNDDSTDDEAENRNLKEHYDSLVGLLAKYAVDHDSEPTVPETQE